MMGAWIIGENENEGWCKCSVCGYTNSTCEVYSIGFGAYNFCPNCGADMRAEQTEQKDCDNCGTPRDKCIYCIAEDRMWTPKQTEPSCDNCANRGDHNGKCRNCVTTDEKIIYGTPSHYEPTTEACSTVSDYERGKADAWKIAQETFHSTVTLYEAEDYVKAGKPTTEDCSMVDPLHDDCFDCDKFFTCDNKGDDYKTDCPWK